MFETNAATMRRRDQEQVLLQLHASGLSFLSLEDISRGAGVPGQRVAYALRILESTRLVTSQERSSNWGLTAEGQRLANARLSRVQSFRPA